jgi:deazaflavin-dependent oxidoreductase (nitroreductase family)
MSVVKRRVMNTFSHYLWNPVMRLVAGRFRGAPALLETIGRKSGRPRRTPVGDGTRGDTFWVIAEHGRHSDWVRNLMADPRVRVKSAGRWRSGKARVMPNDDALARQRGFDRLNAQIVRLAGTDLMTVRIDLEPDGKRAAKAKAPKRTRPKRVASARCA